jgi:signal transduction histidine kinase
MARMIDDLFDLARARLGGGIPVVKERTDFGALVDRVVQEHRAARPERTITLQRDEALEGDWDPHRLAQVASNLIGNALSHGSKNGEVAVHVRAAGNHAVELVVINDGRIAPERLETIFDPFNGGQRRDTASGLGLGLYIVRQITSAHDGTVDVHPLPDDRIAFQVTIPRSEPARSRSGAPRSAKDQNV